MRDSGAGAAGDAPAPGGRALIRVGVLLGARASPWHAEVFRFLPGDLRPTVVGTGEPRYPLEGLELPFEALPLVHQVGPWWRRRALALRYRLTHTWTGFELGLAAPGERLAGFDVLVSWELFTQWTRVALDERARRGVPVAVVVWDNLAGHFADDPRRGPIRRRALAEADAFLVATERSRAALRLDGAGPERVFFVAPSVDPARFAPGSARERRAGLGLAPTDFAVLAVARLEQGKGICYLLQGLALALARAPRLRLVVAGEGGQKAALVAEAERLGIAAAVRWVAGLPYAEMPDLHRAADAFALPSVPTPDWQEQWGQSLLEAMASGRPCLASDSGGVPEVLGDAGLLVRPADPLAIAGALEALALDPGLAADLGKRARSRVEASFDHRRRAQVLAGLLRGLASGRTTRA